MLNTSILVVIGSSLITYSTFSIFKIIKKVHLKDKKITQLTDYQKDMVQRKIIHLKGREFEIFSSEIYKLLGYKTILTPQTNDGGKDIIINKDGKKAIVECKHHANKNTIGRPDAQKLCGAMVADNISRGIILTLNSTSNQCKQYCKKVKGKQTKIENIEIINIFELLEMCPKSECEKILTLLDINDSDTENEYFYNDI